MNINKIALSLTVISVISSIVTGIFGPKSASIISLAILLLIWISWVTISILKMTQKPQDQLDQLQFTSRLPYIPKIRFANNKPLLINSLKRKIQIPSDFLEWNKFTLLFWVKITDDFFDSKLNKYLFAYRSETVPGNNYRNAFFLGIKKIDLSENESDWRFVIGGHDYSKQKIIMFNSNQALKGWKLFSVKWSNKDSKLKFNIDAGKVFQRTEVIPNKCWPQSVKSEFVHFGGWPTWPGGLSYLNFFDLRIFPIILADPELEELYDNELGIINTFK